MADLERRREVSSLLDQRRRELRERTDVSERMRQLSASGSRHPLNPKRGRRPALLMALVAGSALVAMLLCGATAVALIANGVWFNAQLGKPDATAQSFYSALHQQDFQTAYGYFSNGAKSRLSFTQFSATYQAYDQVNGIVESYTVASMSVQNNSANVTVNVVRRSDACQAQAQTLTFVKQGSSWRIDKIALVGVVALRTSGC